MPEYIEREAAKESMCRLCADTNGKDCENRDKCSLIRRLEALPAADAIEELSKRVDESIPKDDAEIIIAEVAKPRWISVTERLPEEMDRSCGGWSAEIRPSDDVLVWLSSEKRQSVAWYSHTYNEWTTVDENTVYCFGEVTHWMPLPEPPKEEAT